MKNFVRILVLALALCVLATAALTASMRRKTGYENR